MRLLIVDVGQEIIEWDGDKKQLVIKIDGDEDEMIREVF